MCTSESLFWRWEFEIEAINLSLSCLAALHPPRARESIREQVGANAPPSDQSSSSSPAGSGGRHTWVVPWEPLFTFKCTHQTIWTSDQILNGVQIMQQRRFFYWGKGGFGCVVFQGTKAWLRSSHCSVESEFRIKKPINYIIFHGTHCGPSCCETWSHKIVCAWDLNRKG